MPLNFNDPLIQQELQKLAQTNPQLYSKIMAGNGQMGVNSPTPPLFAGGGKLSKLGNATVGNLPLAGVIRRYRGMNDPGGRVANTNKMGSTGMPSPTQPNSMSNSLDDSDYWG